MTLTPRQLETVRIVRDYRAEHGVSPTMGEIGAAMGVSKVSAFEHVHACIDKGVLRHGKRKSRSLELVFDPDKPGLDERTKLLAEAAGLIAQCRRQLTPLYSTPLHRAVAKWLKAYDRLCGETVGAR